MAKSVTGPYSYQALPDMSAFRVVELSAGTQDDPISCSLHLVDWNDRIPYEAISYAWGDTTVLRDVIIQGQILHVTENLYTGLKHLRFEDKSRFLWADAICINQKDIPERGQQVNQMRRIYENATRVIIWLGPDCDKGYARSAIEGINTISNFICNKIGITRGDLGSLDNLYQQAIFAHRHSIPVPDKAPFAAEKLWKSLLWFFSHPYFTRLWAIQELNARNDSVLHCGDGIVGWQEVNMVAGYIIMETAFSRQYGFSKAYCWYASIVTSGFVHSRDWLLMLYLASNYKATDQRDFLYGLFGLMEFEDGQAVLAPDYNKSIEEVYRDSVEAALLNFKNTQVLLYVTGNENPSWVPQWNKPMLFRNPRRFGRQLPWKPAGDSSPVWNIDKESNILSLSGFIVDNIVSVHTYNESYFGNAMLTTDGGKQSLALIWQGILATMVAASLEAPFKEDILSSAANAFSFGLDSGSQPAERKLLLENFIAYLKICLQDDETFHKYVSRELFEEHKSGDGLAFGKPVWDFEYPVSSFFVTKNGLIGCCISETSIGDVVAVFQGSLFPTILRPVEGDSEGVFTIRGFSFVDGVMNGEKQRSDIQLLRIK